MKTVTVDERGEIPLAAFEDFVDIDKVKYYSLELREDKSIIVTLYNKNKKKIKLRKTK